MISKGRAPVVVWQRRWEGLSCETQLRPEVTTMTDDKIARRVLLEKSPDTSMLREMIGSAAERINRRTGYRDRGRHARAETVELRIPKLRRGSYVPGRLERRRISERALTAVRAWRASAKVGHG